MSPKAETLKLKKNSTHLNLISRHTPNTNLQTQDPKATIFMFDFPKSRTTRELHEFQGELLLHGAMLLLGGFMIAGLRAQGS